MLSVRPPPSSLTVLRLEGGAVSRIFPLNVYVMGRNGELSLINSMVLSLDYTTFQRFWFVYPGSWRVGFNLLPVRVLRTEYGVRSRTRGFTGLKQLTPSNHTRDALVYFVACLPSSGDHDRQFSYHFIMAWNTRWPMRTCRDAGAISSSPRSGTNVSQLTLTVNMRASSYTWFPLTRTAPEHGGTKTAPRISLAWTTLSIESFKKAIQCLDRVNRHVSNPIKR